MSLKRILALTLLLAPKVKVAGQDDLRLRTGTQEILLDFTARDKHQGLVTDLHESEITVLENGVPQKITGFRYRDCARDPSATGSNAGSSAALRSSYEPLRDLNVMTIVVASLGPESRARAVGFLNDFFAQALPSNTWIGVFALRPQLQVVQSYTNDVALLKRGAVRAAQGSLSQSAREYDQTLQSLNEFAAKAHPDTYQAMRQGSAEERGPANVGNDASTGLRARLAQVTLSMLFAREGPRTIDGLRSVARQQATLPGRKTVLLVCEGLIIPPDRPGLLKSVIAEANRANVTFYALDSRGLSTLASSRSATLASTTLTEVENSGLYVAHTDLQQNARELAEGTGGFSMENSNDLRAPLRRVMEDVRSHYELTYVPTSKNYNGAFRPIEIRCNRPGVSVRGRSGYFALPILLGTELQPFEVGALRALQANPLPKDFRFRANAFGFHPTNDGIAYRIVVEIPTEQLKSQQDEEKKLFRIRTSALALVKDSQDQIIAKAARDLPFEAPLSKWEDFRKGVVTIVLPLSVRPGQFHLDLVIMDRIAETNSVRRSVLSVPKLDGLGASDLVWVKSVQPFSESRDLSNPLETSKGRVIPKIAGEYSASESPQYFFRAYSFGGNLSEISGELTVSQDGKTITTVPMPPPLQDGDGSRIFLGTIPAGSLATGQYRLAIQLKQGEAVREIASDLLIQ